MHYRDHSNYFEEKVFRMMTRPVVVVWMLLLLLERLAYGLDLPSSITAGYTTSNGDTVGASGATLDVTSMLIHAGGNASAVFYADGLMFAGILIVTCPTAADSYLIPLLVTILNGTTQAGMSATHHVTLSGVLAGGSRVSILGGSYTFVNTNPSNFLRAPAAFTVTASSTLEVVGASFAVPTSFTKAGVSTAVMYAELINVSNSSTLSIVNAVVAVRNVSVGGSWSLFVLYAPSTMLSNNSTLFIKGTTIGAHGVNVASQGGNWMMCVVYVFSSATVDDSSNLSIADTTIMVSDVRVWGLWQLYVLYSYPPITLSTNSTLSIEGSTIGVYNTSVAGNWQLYALSVYASATKTQSSLSIT